MAYFQNALYPYAVLKSEALSRFPASSEKLPLDYSMVGIDLNPAWTNDEKEQWEWMNVLDATQRQLVLEESGGNTFPGVPTVCW